MRVCDYVADFLYSKGIDTIFMLSGGGIMYLTDGIKKHGKINYICTHHEQAAGMAAVGYAKASRDVGACLVTTGCGATNAITACLHAWQDSTPVIFISGQVNTKELISEYCFPLRQVGVQEANIIPIVKSITKKAVTIMNADDIGVILDKLYEEATSGRQGPVWLDIPQDIQKKEVEIKQSFIATDNKKLEYKNMDYKIDSIKNLLISSKKPVILAGQGVWLSGSEALLSEFSRVNKIPVVFSRLGLNNMKYNHPCHLGEIGIKGNRVANKAVYNADLLLVLGSRMALASTGYDYDNFAKDAKVIVVDIDEDEHRKRTRKIDIFLQYDICDFLLKIDVENRITRDELDARLNWYKQYKEYCYLNDVASKSKWKDGINMYAFIDVLMKEAPGNCVFVSDAGSSVFAFSQTIRLKGNQSYVTSGAQAEMGFTIPACIGSSQGREGVICGITGDGSFQLNIQELQTIKHYNLPIKLFVLNNGGYLSISTTQDNYFKSDYIGCNKKSGVSFPSLRKIAKAYKIKYKVIKNAKGSSRIIKNIFNDAKPCICEVFCGGNQEISPIIAPVIKEDGTVIPGSFDKMYPELEV